jgi:hypothetical protein
MSVCSPGSAAYADSNSYGDIYAPAEPCNGKELGRLPPPAVCSASGGRAGGIVNMRQELSPFAHEIYAAPKQLICRPHLGRIDVGLGQHPAPQEHSDLVGIDSGLSIRQLSHYSRGGIS